MGSDRFLNFGCGFFHSGAKVSRVAIGLDVALIFVLIQRLFHAIRIKFHIEIVIDVFEVAFVRNRRRGDVDVIADAPVLLKHGDNIHPTLFEEDEDGALLGNPFPAIAFGDGRGLGGQSPIIIGLFD